MRKQEHFNLYKKPNAYNPRSTIQHKVQQSPCLVIIDSCDFFTGPVMHVFRGPSVNDALLKPPKLLLAKNHHKINSQHQRWMNLTVQPTYIQYTTQQGSHFKTITNLIALFKTEN